MINSTHREDTRLTIRVQPHVFQKLRESAADQSVSVSHIIRETLTFSVTRLDPRHDKLVGRLMDLQDEIAKVRVIACAAVSATCQLDTALTNFTESEDKTLLKKKSAYFSKAVEKNIEMGQKINRSYVPNSVKR